MHDIKLFAKNEKELETLIHAVRKIQSGHRDEFGIEKCVMLAMKSGKRHLKMEWNNQIKTRLERSKKSETYKILGHLEGGHQSSKWK